jgi:hypothetical protein
MNCVSMSDWSTILAVQAGAAATLTGLIFVAVSINLQQVISAPGLSGRAAESLLQFVEVFFIATVSLIPGQPTSYLALELLSLGIIFWGAETAGHIRYHRSKLGQPLAWFLPRLLLSQLGAIPFCVAGALLLLGHCDAIYWIVPGFIFSFAAGITSAWVLLVEVLR